jgi:hypothetical protein
MQQRQQQQLRQQPQGSAAGLTLPQVISLVDARLSNLEKFVAEQKSSESSEPEVPTSEWMEEFNKRTEIIAIEIDSLKTSMLQLQTFTMEVNKKLFDKIESLTSAAAIPEVPAIPSVSVPSVVTEASVPSVPSVSDTPIAIVDISNNTQISI